MLTRYRMLVEYNNIYIIEFKIRMSLKNNLITISVISFSLAVGGFAGYFLGSIFNAPKQPGLEYINPKMDDINETYSKLDDFLDGKNINEVNLTDSTLTAADLANIAFDKVVTEHDKVFYVSKGSVDAQNPAIGTVHQIIYSGFMKDNNSYFIESMATSSFVHTGVRFYLNEREEDKNIIYQGSNITDLTKDGTIYGIKGDFANSEKRSTISNDLEDNDDNSLNTEELVKYFGRETYNPSIYQLSNDSVIYNEEITVEDPIEGDETAKTNVVRDSLGNYTITLQLNPQKAIINYAVQMGSMNKMVYDPLFNEILMEIKTDSSLQIITRRVHEFYEVYPAQTNGGPSPTHARSTDYYFYDDDVNFDIPQLTETYNYAYLLENNV